MARIACDTDQYSDVAEISVDSTDVQMYLNSTDQAHEIFFHYEPLL